MTVAATVASMYALDAIATMAGLALVATGLLADLPVPALLAFLVATYASWAVALRANLRRQLGAARADRHEHQRPVEVGI